jgi:ABC-type sugar transport system ATPase subunit
MGDRPILQMQNVSKSFYGFYALKNIDLTVYPGEIHSLLGENGAGKSTLIKILAGINKMDEGSLSIDGQPLVIKNTRHAHELGITVVFQELNLVSSLSVAENIFFGRLPTKGFGRVDWKKLNRDSKILLEEVGLNIDPRTKVGYLGVAQQQLIEIARALSHESKIICMDEPTSALSNKEIERLFELIEKLKKKNVAIIYVSHKFEELFRITDRITVLRDGEKVDEVMTKETTKDELISRMVGRKLNNLYPKVNVTSGETLFKVKNLTSDRIKEASFEIKAGQIVGFSGLMGSGRTELAKAIFGIDKTYSGEIWIGDKQVPRNSPIESKKMGIGYIPEKIGRAHV